MSFQAAAASAMSSPLGITRRGTRHDGRSASSSAPPATSPRGPLSPHQLPQPRSREDLLSQVVQYGRGGPRMAHGRLVTDTASLHARGAPAGSLYQAQTHWRDHPRERASVNLQGSSLEGIPAERSMNPSPSRTTAQAGDGACERVVRVLRSPSNLRSPSRAEVCPPPSDLAPTPLSSTDAAPALSSVEVIVPPQPAVQQRSLIARATSAWLEAASVEGWRQPFPRRDATGGMPDLVHATDRGGGDDAAVEAAVHALQARERRERQRQREWVGQLLTQAAQSLESLAQQCSPSPLTSHDLDRGGGERRAVERASTSKDPPRVMGAGARHDGQLRLHALEAAVIREQQTLLLAERLSREVARVARDAERNAESVTSSTASSATAAEGAYSARPGRRACEAPAADEDRPRTVCNALQRYISAAAESAYRRGAQMRRLWLIAAEEAARDGVVRQCAVAHAALQLNTLAELHSGGGAVGAGLLECGQETHTIGLLAGWQARAEVLDARLRQLRAAGDEREREWAHTLHGLERDVVHMRRDAEVVIARHAAAAGATVQLLERGARSRLEACEAEAHDLVQDLRARVTSACMAAYARTAPLASAVCELLVELERSERRCIMHAEEHAWEHRCVLTRQLLAVRLEAIAEAAAAAERRRRRQEREKERGRRRTVVGEALTSPPREDPGPTGGGDRVAFVTADSTLAARAAGVHRPQQMRQLPIHPERLSHPSEDPHASAAVRDG